MNAMKMLVASAVAAIALAGCETAQEEEEVAAATACPVVESSNWTAWVNRMPGPDATATLSVQGDIVLPTPGYQIALNAGAVDRSAVPTQNLNLELTAPDGMVTQVLTTERVLYQGPAIAEQYRGVRIMCGDDMIAEITDIQDVQ